MDRYGWLFIGVLEALTASVLLIVRKPRLGIRHAFRVRIAVFTPILMFAEVALLVRMSFTVPVSILAAAIITLLAAAYAIHTLWRKYNAACVQVASMMTSLRTAHNRDTEMMAKCLACPTCNPQPEPTSDSANTTPTPKYN
jgi:hypothetical protein